MSNEIEVYKPRPRNAMMIKNLCPGLVELGKIKIGNKGAIRKGNNGDWQLPQKLDRFLITTMERGEDNNFVLDERLHSMLNPSGDRPVRSIPVRLIYDDISLNFATRYICYYGKTVFCSGDGEEAQRLQSDKITYKARTCPCERQDPKFAGDVVNGVVKAGQGKCKINGILSVIIDGAQAVGGVWKFRTTSYNSVVGILSSLALIQRITGGRLAGIPLAMTVTPKTVANPLDGKQQTIYVVGLLYAGTMDSLRDTGYQIAMTEAKHGISMARIEEDAMLMLAHKPVGGAGLGDDLDQDVIEEFYPEEAKPGAPALVGAAESVVKQPIVVGNTDGPVPTLATVTVESEVIVIEGEKVDTGTGEIIEKPAADPVVPEKEKRPRRTKAEMAADALAAQQGAQATSQQAGPPVQGLANDEGWADSPGTVKEEQPPHPGDEQPIEETTGNEPEPMADLF